MIFLFSLLYCLWPHIECWSHINGILPKGPYPPCLRMADRALLAGYPRYIQDRNLVIIVAADARPLAGTMLTVGLDIFLDTFLDLPKGSHFHIKSSIHMGVCHGPNKVTSKHCFSLGFIAMGGVPDVTKPLPESMLTCDPRHVPQCNFNKNECDVSNKICIWKWNFQNHHELWSTSMSHPFSIAIQVLLDKIITRKNYPCH